MTDEFTIDAGEPVLVQFEQRGLQPVSRDDHLLVEKSQQALESAMSTIRTMGKRIVATIKKIDKTDRPAEVEVEFGLVLEAEAGALIAKAKTQAAFTVKLKWVAEKSEDVSG